MTNPTRVLLIDDDEEDCFITETLLDDAPGAFALTWRSGYAQGLSELETARFDVCFVDYQIGGETGLAFVERAKSKGIVCPMILLTGVGQRDVDIAASEVGAADFLDKANLTPTLIERAIRYAIAHSKALQALSEQTNVLETTLESIQAGIAAFDASGALITSNRRFGELMRELSQLRAERYEELVVSEDEFCRMLQDLLLQAPQQAIEIDGLDHKVYEFRIDPITGGGHVLLAVDVSAQKSLQSTLLQAKADAEAASQTKSAFLATMSHELRTPMNGVLGTAALLKITPLNPEQRQLVKTITTSGNALLALIEDLLDISMIEQGKFGLQREDVDPSQLVAEALDLVHAAHRSAALEMTTNITLSTRRTAARRWRYT